MQIIPIRDFDATELDAFARRTERQLLNREHPEDGLFIAESPKVIARALDAAYEPISFLCDERELSGEAAPLLERCADIPVYTAPFDVLTQLTGFALTRGLLCAMRRKPIPSLASLCRNARRIAVLENVVNPTNIGAIFRSAAALGVDALVLTPACCDPLYRRSIRVSMGTVFQLPWGYCTFANEVRSHGFRTVSLALRDDALSLDDPILNSQERLAVVLGTEGDGLADATICDSDFTVRIPMSHGVDSLNVAAASAVAFWQLCRNHTF